MCIEILNQVGLIIGMIGKLMVEFFRVIVDPSYLYLFSNHNVVVVLTMYSYVQVVALNF